MAVNYCCTVKDQSFTHHQSFTRSNVKSRRSHPLAKFFLHIYLQCIDSFFCEFLCTLVCCACHNTENIPKILNHWNFLRFGNMLKASRRVSDKNGKHCIINHYVFVAKAADWAIPMLCSNRWFGDWHCAPLVSHWEGDWIKTSLKRVLWRRWWVDSFGIRSFLTIFSEWWNQRSVTWPCKGMGNGNISPKHW